MKLVDSIPNSTLPRTYNALVAYYEADFHVRLAKGDFEPYLLFYSNLGILVFLLYLILVPVRSGFARSLIYPVYGFFVYWNIRAIYTTKSNGLGVSYFGGISIAWYTVWGTALVIFNDIWSLKRIEKRNPEEIAELQRKQPTNQRSVGNSHDAAGTSSVGSSGEAKTRKSKVAKTENTSVALRSGSESKNIAYYWQTFPQSISLRVGFVFDLWTAIRGTGWMHQARVIPGPPKEIADQLDPPPPTFKAVVVAYSDKKSLLRANIFRFLRHIAYLDIIKTIMTHDPYFLGFVEPRPPAPFFFPEWFRTNYWLTGFYRIYLTTMGVRLSLGLGFVMVPLICVGIMEPIMGLRGSPWYYPEFEGTVDHLYKEGFPGWWGGWWHQAFRLGFEAPSRWVGRHLGWHPRSMQLKIFGTLVAFGLSGVIHAFGSIRMLGHTNPWTGAFAYFMLQVIPTILQDIICQILSAAGITQKLPKIVRYISMCLWLALFGVLFGQFFGDDLATGGIWLSEPIPFSVLKGIGFGEPNDRFWRWTGTPFYWVDGTHWWNSGLAM